MDTVERLPGDLQRQIVLHHRRARARHFWRSVRDFLKRFNILMYIRHDIEKDLNLHILKMKSTPLRDSFGWRTEYNIRSRRGVKRPLEDLLGF